MNERLPPQHVRSYKEPDLAIDEFFLADQSIDKEKHNLRKQLGMTSSVKKEAKQTFYEKLSIRLHRAGIEAKPAETVKKILLATIGLVLLGALLLGFISLYNGVAFLPIVLYLFIWFIVGFFISYAIVNIIFRTYLSLHVFKRKLAVEAVLPDFLRLVATNYRSGMSIDKALEKSNRPRFGIFSKEINIVIKTARVKGDLPKALEIFGKKFDSKILQRAMNNLIISIKSGSNISALLEEIAANITKMRNMRASMAANVKNYIIFIIVAGVIIAPLMFSMSAVMNGTIAGVKDSITIDQSVSAGPISALPEDGGIQGNDFLIFAILMLVTNSIVSASVISMIKHGNFQQGIPQIPIFFVISLALFLVGRYVLGMLIAVI